MDLSALARLDGWALLAGLGLFLLGMDQLERAVHAVAGNTFRTLLRRATSNLAMSIAVGIVATGLLQSSSMLGLMVLAFVGAGILPMRNALGVILGSNIGSTFTGWIVALVGFRLDLESMALPMIGLGAIGVAFFAAETRRHAWSSVFLALGLLLLGMRYMVTAATGFSSGFNPAQLAGEPAWMFFVVGLFVTVIVRTSAATIMMAMSAMSVGILDLQQAAAIAIGADLGTTSTMLIAAIKGVAAKKQVAVFHVLFNSITDCLAFFLLLPHVAGLAALYGITDPLVAVAAFHSTFNILGAVLFLPFVGRIGDFLDKRFRGAPDAVAEFLPRVPVDEPDAAGVALDNETRGLLRRVVALNAHALKLAKAADSEHTAYGQAYDTAKQLEGEVLGYAFRMQSRPMPDETARRLANLIVVAREAIQSAKGVKDVREELVSFRHAPNAWLSEYAHEFHEALAAIYALLDEALESPEPGVADKEVAVERLAKLDVREAETHALFKRRAYTEALFNGASESELSTMLNVLHEVHGSNRALLRALRGLLLDELN